MLAGLTKYRFKYCQTSQCDILEVFQNYLTFWQWAFLGHLSPGFIHDESKFEKEIFNHHSCEPFYIKISDIKKRGGHNGHTVTLVKFHLQSLKYHKYTPPCAVSEWDRSSWRKNTYLPELNFFKMLKILGWTIMSHCDDCDIFLFKCIYMMLVWCKGILMILLYHALHLLVLRRHQTPNHWWLAFWSGHLESDNNDLCEDKD